jgi:hypothetical protein
MIDLQHVYAAQPIHPQPSIHIPNLNHAPLAPLSIPNRPAIPNASSWILWVLAIDRLLTADR